MIKFYIHFLLLRRKTNKCIFFTFSDKKHVQFLSRKSETYSIIKFKNFIYIKLNNYIFIKVIILLIFKYNLIKL